MLVHIYWIAVEWMRKHLHVYVDHSTKKFESITVFMECSSNFVTKKGVESVKSGYHWLCHSRQTRRKKKKNFNESIITLTRIKARGHQTTHFHRYLLRAVHCCERIRWLIVSFSRPLTSNICNEIHKLLRIVAHCFRNILFATYEKKKKTIWIRAILFSLSCFSFLVRNEAKTDFR